jgi:uncharacterized Zn finger protein
MRENAAVKGRRYLIEGRVRIIEANDHDGTVTADVRGDGASYNAGRDEHGWFCNCPARGQCAHLVALGLIVALEPAGPTP